MIEKRQELKRLILRTRAEKGSGNFAKTGKKPPQKSLIAREKLREERKRGFSGRGGGEKAPVPHETSGLGRQQDQN